jgi:CO dehydrogenase nickel-insertion accessory protein CooC1
MILTTKQIIELIRNRDCVHVVDTDALTETVSVRLEEAKPITIIINNQDIEAIKRARRFQKQFDEMGYI